MGEKSCFLLFHSVPLLLFSSILYLGSLHASPSMGFSDVPRPVFVETNLGTRLAVPVSPDITAKEFKGELEMKHLSCFPEIGSIRVDALLVKRKSCCYHLSESLPLKFAFRGSKRTWFLQVHVHLFKCNDKKVLNPSSAAEFVTAKKRTKHRRKKQKTTKKKENTFTETFSESVSVSGIIRKYFSDYDEVESGKRFPYYTKAEANSGNGRKYMNIQKCTKPEVGKRLLLASDSLCLTSSNQKPAISLCRGCDGNSSAQKLEGVVRHLVFEITDEGD